MADKTEPDIRFHPLWGWMVVAPTRPQGAGYTEFLHRKLDRQAAERRLAERAEIDRREAERWLKFRAKCRAADRGHA